MTSAQYRLEDFQRKVAVALIALAVLQVPALMTLAFMRDIEFPLVTLTSLILAATPLGLFLAKRPLMAVAAALALAMVGHTSLLVFAMRGHPWQIEGHFYYFALLAMLAGFCSWRITVFTASLIAAEHLVFNFLLPEAVFPGEASLLRVLVHALVVVIETAMLVGIGLTIQAAFRDAGRAHDAAIESADALGKTAASREELLVKTADHAQNLRALTQTFEGEMQLSIDTLYRMATEMLESAEQLGVSSAKTCAQVVTVSSASEDTAWQVGLVAQAGDELAKTIDEVGASAAKSSQLATAAVEEAERTNQTMKEMVAVADEIGKVTDMISGIAAQTNLLALNATIEAARAGEAGRGFSVVAQEVKALATQTAKATHDIASRIAAIQNTSLRSAGALQAMSQRIRELDGVAATIAGAVEEQAAATREIAHNVSAASGSMKHVENSIAEIEQVTENNTRSVAKVGQAANELANQTRAIRKLVSGFADSLKRMRA